MALDDTHPTMRDAQIARLRQMTSVQRFAIVEQLTADTVRWSRAAIRESMPGAEEWQVIHRWIELVYGRDLATGIAPIAHRLGEPAASR